jgi:regulator of RNase E activity RraA
MVMRGTIQSLNKTSGGGFNEKGEPIPDSSSWGNPVECLYVANIYNNRGTYQDGVFTQSEYSITTKDLTFKATEILLSDKDGNVVCRKPVQRLELLESVKRVKIIV